MVQRRSCSMQDIPFRFHLPDYRTSVLSARLTFQPLRNVSQPGCVSIFSWKDLETGMSTEAEPAVKASWNVMAHERLSAKRTSPFKSAGASVQSTTGSRGVRISGSNGGYTMFRGSVKSTGYPLHSPVSSSLPLPCVTVCHHISAAV